MSGLRKLKVLVVTAASATVLAEPAAGSEPPPDARYVDDHQCAACHRAIYRSYQQVGMARSLARPRVETAIEDFQQAPFFHEPSQRYYQMVIRDGTYLFRRYQLDENGDEVNLFEQPPAWIIGSGNHSRGYLYRTPSGELFQLPLVWYTQAKRWGMAPGYDNAYHDGVTRPITRECLFCHNAYPDVPPGSDAYGMPHVFPENLPEGTGCQRCHGPGSEHVRLAQDLDTSDADVMAAIVNPARLSPQRRDDVCFQCHLQPTSRLTSFVRRFGRDDYSYRPGEDLADYLVHLDFDDVAPESDRFEINHHPYRLRQSRCFIESGGELNCLTCHDPHRVVPADQAVTWYRDRCLECHEPSDCQVDSMHRDAAGTRADDCVTCHMPKRRTQDVVGVVMTDHRITRRGNDDPLAALSEATPPQGATVKYYFPRRAPQEPQGSVYRAISAAGDGDLAAADALRALIGDNPPTRIEPFLELATAQLGGGNPAEALGTLGLVLQRWPDHPLAVANAGVALSALGQRAEAVQMLGRAVQLDPDVADHHYNLAATLARLGRNEDAVRHYEMALTLRPNYAKAWLNLGNILAREGRYRRAAEAYQRALGVNPDLVAASRNLGTALRYLDDWQGAVRVWTRAAHRAPAPDGIARELAMARLIATDESVHDFAEGLQWAQVAAKTVPDGPKTAAVLAVALLFNGRWIDAVAAAERADELGADDATVLLVKALAWRGSGKGLRSEAAWNRARQAMALSRQGDRLRMALLERAEAVFQ